MQINAEELKKKSVVELKAMLYDVNVEIQVLNTIAMVVGSALDEKLKEEQNNIRTGEITES